MGYLKFSSISKRAKWVVNSTWVLAALNFFVFFEGSIYLGGDALNGYVQAGHFFVCAHGHCSEVSSPIWHYSYWHAYSAFLGIVLVFAEIALFIHLGDIKTE